MAMCSTLILESVLRPSAELSSTVTTASAAFTDVTGKYDTSKIREENFNDSVLKTEDVVPVYETRTVMVTLSSAPIADRAGNEGVPVYAKTFSGERAKSEIATEQLNFLQALSKKGISYQVEHQYATVTNAVAIEVDTKYVSEIKEMEGVDTVVVTTAFAAPKTVDTPSSTNDDVVTNQTETYDTGIFNPGDMAKYGEGMVVAVLDTGLDYTHDAFQQFQSIAEGTKTKESFTMKWDEEYVSERLAGLEAMKRSGSLSVSEVYMSDKVPFAYDYADSDADVYPSYSNHGTHVAGIIGGYDPNGYTDKDGVHVNEKEDVAEKRFLGVVPDAQLMICKVFTDDLDDEDLGGAESVDIVAALDDCVNLGVDVINMSLGSSCGFTTTDDGDDEGQMLDRVYNRVKDQGISLICAASNDYSAGYGGVYGTNLASNPDAGTVGSPSTFVGALSVASINGQKSSYLIANEATSLSYVFFEEARDINSNAMDFVAELNKAYPEANGEFEYVVVPGIGSAGDYNATIKNKFKEKKRIALVKRGTSTFQEKVEIAMSNGAAGVIIYNNVAGSIRMNLGEVENPVPSISITMNAGAAMVSGAVNRVGTLKIDKSFAAGPFMSDFSSWGPTPDLKLKPEITAHGGEITSTVPGGYGEQSGTSMASPNLAGFMTIVRGYLSTDEMKTALASVGVDLNDKVALNRLAAQLTMSTAATVYDQENLPYSPRKQGAGVAKLENVVGGTKAYLYTKQVEEDSGKLVNDGRPKVECGANKEGVYTLEFSVQNFGTSPLTFNTASEFMTETLSRDKITVSEQARMLTSSKVEWKASDNALSGNKITVPAGESVDLTVTLTLSDADKKYINDSFENGMYVEGFAKLQSQTDGQCDLSLPFLGFFGDWAEAPMLDYSAYEVAADAQDASVLEEEKIQASVWATQPYNIYYNDKYVLPMGGYLYQLPEDVELTDPMYVDEKYNSVSRYDEYYGEGDGNNYLTSTGIKAVYAGLLRNARQVQYRLIDEATGEVIYSSHIDRVAKAYAGGGSAVPANVKLELYPEEMELTANGRYRMEFDFYREEVDSTPDDNFEFSFTVDYEAPMMQNARIRYYNYKDGKKEKQRIYLDVDVYDNHYAQTLMVCYPKETSTGTVLQLATEYPTPIRNAVKNGMTTVSVEITDFYEKYGSQLYVQIDDYALNTCLYELNIDAANKNILPEGKDFALTGDKLTAENGKYSLTLDVYEAVNCKVAYGEDYKGDGDTSNFLWASSAEDVVRVKNGSIVGVGEGTATVTVGNRSGITKQITVTVKDTSGSSLTKTPLISFGVIKTNVDALEKAAAGQQIKVNAGKTFELEIVTEPWYFPLEGYTLSWTTSKADVASVEDGVVTTHKKGLAVITAKLLDSSGKTVATTSTQLRVQEEFKVSNFTLTAYNGPGGDVVIPDDMNIMYIGAEAFKENDNVTSITIPSSVMEIRERAFIDCIALEKVSFDKDADVSMIYQNAFEGCINLKTVDFTNVKVVTVAADCFKDCAKLETVLGMTKIGTMHHRAFAGTALKEVDLSGLHMSGKDVFKGCLQLASVTTGKFTAIGESMFEGCTALREKITIRTPKVGAAAFKNCTNLTGVEFVAPDSDVMNVDIGASAFENCGTTLRRGNFVANFSGTNVNIRSIGNRAFMGSSLKAIGEISGLKNLGEKAFYNTEVTSMVIGDDMDIDALRLTGVLFEGLEIKLAAGVTKYEQDSTGEVADVIYNQGRSKILYVRPNFTGDSEGKFIVPSTVREIGEYAFSYSKINEVDLGAIGVLGEGAFKNAYTTKVDLADTTLVELADRTFEKSKVKSVILPDCVERIGSYVFDGSALSEFKGEGVKEIAAYGFTGCNALQSILLPESVEKIGDYAFYGCINLTAATISAVKANTADETSMGVGVFVGCSKLETVTFGENAMETGTFTFMGTPVKHVSFAANTGIEKIDEGAFYNATTLEEITLPENCVTIADGAFANARKLTKVNGINKIEVFGDSAFMGTALTELKLDSAKKIGNSAFARLVRKEVKEGELKTYVTLSLPVVEEIESMAFLQADIKELSLPASLKSLGYGVFASADALATVSVAEGNANFFAEDNVLYRNTDTAGSYELVYYPAAREQEEVNDQKLYVVKEGTVRILAYAFYDLNPNMVNAVELPYTLNAIGDSAFFDSGITSYDFKSIKAPTLETSYREDVREIIKLNGSSNAEYKGYYYTNFYDYFYKYSRFGTSNGPQSESPLTIYYPVNGSGYDNHVYSTYFGKKIPSSVALIEDETRECLALIAEMPDLADIDGWANEIINGSKEDAEAWAEKIKTARIYYNNAKADAGQQGFVADEKLGEKLDAVEKKFREVKEHHDIKSYITDIRVAEDSKHRTEYLVGEKFDMTGLSAVYVYDDFSTSPADLSKLTLITQNALTKDDVVVVFEYVTVDAEGNSVTKPLQISVTVRDENEAVGDNPTDTPAGSDDENVGSEEGMGVIGVVIIIAVVVGIVVCAVILALLAKKKKLIAAEEREKRAALRAYENEYGELHTDIQLTVYGEDCTDEEAFKVKQALKVFRNSLVDVKVPEGGKIKHTVKTRKNKKD